MKLVLDETEGKRQKGDVNNLVGFASSLSKAAKRGEFVPRLALQVQVDREKRLRHAAAVAAAAKPSKPIAFDELSAETYNALPPTLREKYDEAKGKQAPE